MWKGLLFEKQSYAAFQKAFIASIIHKMEAWLMKKNSKSSTLKPSTKKLPQKSRRPSQRKVLAGEMHGASISKLIPEADNVVRSVMPDEMEPMQATRIEKPFNDPNFIYEVKWDGYRIVARLQKGKVKLFSRKGLDYTSK